MQEREKVYVSWSGGKDSYLSLLKAQEAGLEIATLMTYFRENKLSNYHRLRREVLKRQADALGFKHKIIQVPKKAFDDIIVRVMNELREQGITGAVSGDINIQANREWLENVCSQGKMNLHLPLWGISEEKIIEELRQRGCRLLIVALRHRQIDPKWLGKELDDEFIEMCRQKGITPCGERGEYHTLAFDGPLFKKPVQVLPGKTVIHKNHAFLDLG